MKSRDIALIIMFAVLNLVLFIMMGQLPELITGIPAFGYVFIIFYAITGSVALLMYEGRDGECLHKVYFSAQLR